NLVDLSGTWNLLSSDNFEGYTLALSLVTWDNDKLTCVQKGEKKSRGWRHRIKGDQLHLEMFCQGQVCKQMFQRA
uniref:Uncharacterized protein n=1 Tax=Nannospalax galili TaxID=1026970 RepID=A0A8C6WBJ7_NANGA